MIIQKVVLDNIRSHTHFEFEPALGGLTVISGVNGAGKSTIINAFAWSLFGAKAQSKTKVKDYVKYGVDPKETYCGVNSYILVGNREYRIERRILSTGGGSLCNVYSRPINSDEDYVLDCGPGVVHSENFIKSLLGFDETGFYSSSFIQQKNVDLIVSAGPRERATIIERMIGVKSISEALAMAREESRSLQRSLSIIQTGSIEEQEQKVTQQRQLVIELTEKMKNEQVEHSQFTESLEQLTQVYSQEKEKQDLYAKLHQEELLLETDVKNLNERLANQMELLSTYNNQEDLVFSEAAYQKAEEEFQQSNQENLGLEKELALLNKEKEQLDQLFNQKIDKALVKQYKAKSQEQEEVKTKLNDLILTLNLLKNDREKATVFLKELEQGIAHCPYCKNEITDVNEEISKHTQLLQTYERELSQKETERSQLTERSNHLLNELVSLQKSMDILALQEQSKVHYQNLKKSILDKEQKLKLNSRILEMRRKHLQTLTSIKDQSKAIETTKATIKLIMQNAQESARELKEKQEEIAQLNALSAKDFKKLETDYNKLYKDKTNIDMQLLNTQRELEVAKVQGKAYLQELKNQQKAQQEYSKIAHQLTIVNSSIQALTDFKDLRTKTSTPSLSNIATDLFSKFTDGAFSKFILDEKFETYVETNKGEVRSVNVLSGGEESAAAIALRLAIALFLSEGTQSLLVLDEILASMDDHRQQLILETIKEFTNAQVILVAHSQVANSFADKLVTLE